MEFPPDRDLNGDAPVLGAPAFGGLVGTLAGDYSVWKSLDEPPSAENLKPKKMKDRYTPAPQTRG